MTRNEMDGAVELDKVALRPVSRGRYHPTYLHLPYCPHTCSLSLLNLSALLANPCHPRSFSSVSLSSLSVLYSLSSLLFSSSSKSPSAMAGETDSVAAVLAAPPPPPPSRPRPCRTGSRRAAALRNAPLCAARCWSASFYSPCCELLLCVPRPPLLPVLGHHFVLSLAKPRVLLIPFGFSGVNLMSVLLFGMSTWDEYMMYLAGTCIFLVHVYLVHEMSIWYLLLPAS
ncbi:hypothetical protein BRADI_3g28933v3 [Brachypodium distachyon]|uniref:Uncharacterized protein n=1 Tax=Brachypodium distachyon TaxID=15368 RepID=A0A2K2CZV2_BRADI|nr:hypothetical protein BRADI_3g28933v3 [Brachypodium distachyon]